MSNDISNSKPPGFEEFQRQMQEFMKQHLPHMNATPPPESESKNPPSPEETSLRPDDFKFDYKPKEVKAHLDRFVIKQDEAKKVLSVALCDHYHHVQQALSGRATVNYAKQNIILLGPTGVGKTYLIRSMAELIGVPFVKADATKFSETGYVGGDAEDLVRDLVRKANGDIRRAEYGIIYIDEIDKIASSKTAGGRDVSGQGVQTNLLKLMEETDVPARAPNDIAGQIQAMMESTQRGKSSSDTVNTKHILFVVSGAFEGLEEIVRRRERESSIGFSAQATRPVDVENIFQHASTRDFIDYGFEPEFIGRLPVRVVCNPLSVDDLFEILTSSEGSIVRQYEDSFAAYNIDIVFKEGGLRKVAEMAVEEKTGARGLMTVCERVFRDLKFELPSTDVRRFYVDESMVVDPQQWLQSLMAKRERFEVELMSNLVTEFAQRFEENHKISLVFTDGAMKRLVEESTENSRSIRDLCGEKFKDFQFGLKLIAQNTGKSEFEIDEAVVEAPDKSLSEWVVQSYQAGEKQGEPSSSSSEE